MGMLCRLYMQCPQAGTGGGCCWLGLISPTPTPTPARFALAWSTGPAVLVCFVLHCSPGTKTVPDTLAAR